MCSSDLASEGEVVISVAEAAERQRLEAQLQVLDSLRQPRLVTVAADQPQRLAQALGLDWRFEWIAARQPFRQVDGDGQRAWLASLTALAAPGARGRWLLSHPQLGPSASLLAVLDSGKATAATREARRLLRLARPVDEAWLSAAANAAGDGADSLSGMLDALGWRITSERWQESLELRLDAALLERWFAAGAPYRQQLERALSPAVAEAIAGLFRQRLGVALPQPLEHVLLESRLVSAPSPGQSPQPSEAAGQPDQGRSEAKAKRRLRERPGPPSGSSAP